MKATITSAAALATLFGAPHSLALGLGEARLSSDLSQPLRASIPLVGLAGSGVEPDDVRVDVPSHWDHEAMGFADPVLPRDLKVALVTDGSGGVMVRMTTSRTLREPVLRFVLRAQWSGGSVLREYEFIIDPPLLVRRAVAPEVPLTSVMLAPASASAPVPVPAPLLTPAAAPAPRVVEARAGSAYGPVRSGETLYAIAAAAYPEQASEMSRVTTAIVARNPGAFLNGDVNRMLTGVMLILPAKEDTAKAPGPAADARHAATSTYTVMPGDTLYGIARRELGVSGDGLAQTVARLYADNADAFLDGDRDRLQVGAVLRLGVSADATVPVAIPTSAPATVAAVVPAGASVEHSEQTAAARKDAAAGDQAARSDVSIATVPTVTAVPLPQLSELVDQVSAADETITSEEASSSALRSRLDALLGELESLRARDAELTAKTEAVTAALMNRRLDAASGSPAPAPATAQPASSSAGSGIAALTTGPAAGGAGFGFWVGAGALILALLGGAVFARRRGGAAPEPRAVADEEATRRKLAEVRERHGSTGSFEAEDLQAAGADVAPRDPGNVHMTEAAHASALAKEAAVHLAYGDYKTAKRNIEEAIRMDPHRDEHKMLLITVYENTGEHAKAREIVDDLLTRREQLPRELRQQVEQLRRHAGG